MRDEINARHGVMIPVKAPPVSFEAPPIGARHICLCHQIELPLEGTSETVHVNRQEGGGFTKFEAKQAHSNQRRIIRLKLISRNKWQLIRSDIGLSSE